MRNPILTVVSNARYLDFGDTGIGAMKLKSGFVKKV